MPKRPRKAALTDPSRDALATVERDTAEEAEILRDIDESGEGPAAEAAGRGSGPARKAALTAVQRKAPRKAAAARRRKT